MKNLSKYMEPEFVTGEAAVVFGKRLVVSDLHIGIEHEYYTSGIKIESQTGKMRKRLDKIIKMTKADGIIFLGDVKHKIPGISYQELKEIPEFMNHFSEKLNVTVAMGNHDPGIENLGIRNLVIKPTVGFVSDSVYYTHGHAWPDKTFLKCKYLIMGHLQPQIEFKDKLGYAWQEPVWVKAHLDPNKVEKKYRSSKNLPQVLIMPSFNTLAGGLILNKKKNIEKRKEHNGPIMKLLKTMDVDIHLLDGTFLGKLKNL